MNTSILIKSPLTHTRANNEKIDCVWLRTAVVFLVLTCVGLLPTFSLQASDADAANAGLLVEMQTSKGRMVIELDKKSAPTSVENFLNYVNEGFYDGTIFHRVIDGFMIQGGGFTPDFNQKKTRDPIQNEANNGLKNRRYTISMARTSAPHSATAQFFINTVDNNPLDYTEPTQQGWGYAVFGRVIEGFDVVDAISGTTTGPGGPFPRDTPQQTITIEKVIAMETPDATAEPKTE